MKKEDVERLARMRRDSNPNFEGKGKRLYKSIYTEDIIGAAGELAFAEKYNFKIYVNEKVKGKKLGDNHIDFKLKINDSKTITIDIKTYQKAYNLLVKEWEIDKCSDILVLAQYIDEENVEFLGWTTKKTMKGQPKRCFNPKLNIQSYFLHKTKLVPMDDLDYLLKNSKIEQICHL